LEGGELAFDAGGEDDCGSWDPIRTLVLDEVNEYGPGRPRVWLFAEVKPRSRQRLQEGAKKWRGDLKESDRLIHQQHGGLDEFAHENLTEANLVTIRLTASILAARPARRQVRADG
jgi:hypothetical protein